ncbi:hypothetical protein NKR23_g11715 [Pleurostoma richardsiae]|uniref:Uncharacterized protein n=1 Tax=Pleurostoma richardsiae TaxID=41990 RepID=A0AA38RA13_9PEZI|nr:hypothetical protein NKR23_g11715 [Pleurostoma richardsiae]
MSQPPQGLSEKQRLQAHYDELDRQQQQQEAGPSSPQSASSPPGTSNAVPVQQEEGVTKASASTSASASASTSGLHYDQPREPTPPPYSGPSSPSQADLAPARLPKGPQKYPGLPVLDYRLYSPPLFNLSADTTTIKSTAPYLSSTVAALVSLIRAQSTVPPKPQVHITGSRGRKVDFDIKLNLMHLLVPEDPRQRMDYIRCVGSGEPALRGSSKPTARPEVSEGGLEEWCRRFIEDTGPVKTFTLERVVVNLDTAWLEGQVRSLVAATGYKGAVGVSFPLTHARVVVQNPDKVNKFFTGITTLFTGKRQYEVAKAVWPFATHPHGEEGRRCAVQSEETWWREWKDPIRYAVATKRHGWVTNEDKLEVIMEGKGKGVSIVDWGPEV